MLLGKLHWKKNMGNGFEDCVSNVSFDLISTCITKNVMVLGKTESSANRLVLSLNLKPCSSSSYLTDTKGIENNSVQTMSSGGRFKK